MGKPDWEKQPFVLLQVDHALYPLSKVWDFGVDAIFALLTAAFTEAGDAVDGPSAVLLAQQRATRVPGTRVNPAALVSGAKHVFADVIVLVDIGAFWFGYDWNLWRKKANN